MTSPLMHAVRAVFAADGALARAEPHFHPRAGQTAMAEAVAQTIADCGVLVVEAGTGVGKTYSYLVPALLSGKRVVVSTATKALQDQLFARDLPRLVQSLGLPLRMARLKGRSSYLCQQRLLQVRLGKQPLDAQVLRAVARVEDWSRSTRSGDMAELPDLAEDSQVIPLVTSTRDNCVGRECAHWQACHVNRARQQALEADVAVVNHHLFFADMEVRESGMAQLLPQAGVVVIDEAHQLNETGIQFAGLVLSSNQLLAYARDVMQDASDHARGMADWLVLAARVQQAVRDWRLVASTHHSAQPRLRWQGLAPETLDAAQWRAATVHLGQALRAVVQALAGVLEMAPALVHLQERGQLLLQRLAHFVRPAPDDAVRWLDVGRQHLRLTESPLSIARLVRGQLMAGHPALEVRAFSDADLAPGGAWAEGAEPAADEGEAELVEPAEQGSDTVLPAAPAAQPAPLAITATAPDTAAAHTAWIFTSATLGLGDDLRWFTEPCGLHGAQVLRVDSPFDYVHQAALYVPERFPLPGDAKHSDAVAQLAGDGAAALGGRTLVLTTTLRALEQIGRQLRARFGLLEPMDVLVQGQGSKHALMERFRAGTVNGRGCVLVASSTFWEGVDIPGDALQLVVIDKLPFPPPDDPLVEARSRQLEQLGRNPFADYVLPEAALALKQGAGRLIRTETDRGILVVTDIRLRTKGYGRSMVEALPPMRRLGTEAAWEEALQELRNPAPL
ncbi:ATP-dependent DNA helicase [Comamonas sp. UBA7528]|uniref:ATP-dependent DNA helicase n=1 Tax=Comamonas sp. UBA7528 TaxID=1946391 RepID=UPI0025BB6891|nr:ATP-dependent DNA helicase [Comamonas sp. UBA7528]